MRQIHVKQNPILPTDMLGSSTVLNVPSDFDRKGILVHHDRLNYLNVPFQLKRLDGYENDFKIHFELTQGAASMGVLLIGAYLEDDNIRVILGTVAGITVNLPVDFPLLKLSFVELVNLRAIAPYVSTEPALRRPVAAKQIKKVKKKK